VPQPDDPEFQAALDRAGDVDRRLDGEDPDTVHLEDARHWETVYQELHAFKDGVLKSARERGAAVRKDGQDEVRSDLTILSTEATRLKARLEFWRRRRAELERHPQ
jgi:hypothetical protein